MMMTSEKINFAKAVIEKEMGEYYFPNYMRVGLYLEEVNNTKAVADWTGLAVSTVKNYSYKCPQYLKDDYAIARARYLKRFRDTAESAENLEKEFIFVVIQ